LNDQTAGICGHGLNDQSDRLQEETDAAVAAEDPPSASAEAGSRPTIEDVARAAGVSRQTVSNVINAPERVSETTRLETEAAIERLGYRSNAIARNLRQRSSRLIGYRVPAAQRGAIHPVLDGFLHALTSAARAQGKSVLLFVPPEEGDEASVHEEMLGTSAVDGLVLTDTTPDDPRVEFLARRGLPFASFGRTELELEHSWVDIDGAAGTSAAVRHLVANGHRRIGYLGWICDFGYRFDRRRGYEQGLISAGIDLDPALDVGVNDEAEAAAAAAALLALDDPPTALVSSSDALALGAVRGARSSGALVGRDGLAVIGFDDTPMAALAWPSLTSVRQPLDEAARVLVRLLDDRLAGRPAEGVLLEPELVIRESA
jgi:DNA-binding LacI/PurR family transcriptional regulator